MNAIKDRVTTILTGKFGVKPEELSEGVVLSDLRFDSLALLELALTFSEEFDIFVAHDELSINHTIVDTVELVEAKGVTV
ncbi:acyl carrier protein [Streptomyces sp. TLI_171]|uniref:acyl carrier protein n=1 Tax=Streptomyces sp. TLI_171 TaxID=1938859 RepID=UPI000C192730|nr:acyl carrier protein [Streptomyces sp. TLI_171]RKE20785.1 acyl carrier protein [Streptomyces sp. TLI_171]